MIKSGVFEVFTRNPVIKEKATKDLTLVAIILCVKELTEYLYQ